MNFKAVLFDLDNTLILFDEKEFYKAYTEKLSQHFRDIFTLQAFAQKLMASTKIMTNNNGLQCNAEFFFNDFSVGLDIDKKEIWNRFEKFYNTEFDQLKYLMHPIPNTRELVVKIQLMGLKIVIASNPMLPANVQQLRLNWAGLEGIEFDLITDALNSSFCKPNPDYYLEICKKINIKPQNCLMVGNDPFNDMIATKINMKTFLTTDSENNSVEVSRKIASIGKLEIPKPDYNGKLNEILNLLEN